MLLCPVLRRRSHHRRLRFVLSVYVAPFLPITSPTQHHIRRIHMSRSPLPVVATTRHRRRHALLRHRRRCSDPPPRERLVGVHHLTVGVRVPHGHLAVRLGEVRDGRAGRQGRHGLHVGRLEGRVRRGSRHHERRGRGGVHRVHCQTHVASPVTADARPAGVGLHTRLLGVWVPRGEVVMRSLLLPLRLAVFLYVL